MKNQNTMISLKANKFLTNKKIKEVGDNRNEYLAFLYLV